MLRTIDGGKLRSLLHCSPETLNRIYRMLCTSLEQLQELEGYAAPDGDRTLFVVLEDDLVDLLNEVEHYLAAGALIPFSCFDAFIARFETVVEEVQSLLDHPLPGEPVGHHDGPIEGVVRGH